MEVRDEEQRVVCQVVERRKGEQDAGEPAQHECHDERERVEHRHGEAYLAHEHRPDPVVDLHAGRHADRHRCDTERGVDRGILPHREEVVDPDRERQHRDRHRRDDQGLVAVQFLRREGRDHLGIDPECGQDENVDLRVAEQPEQVGVHHHVATERVGEKMKPQIAIQRQHSGGDGQGRHGEDHQDAGAQRGPYKQGHAHQLHAGAAHLVDRYSEVQPGQRRADRTERHCPDPVVGPDARTEHQLGVRRVAAPARRWRTGR